MCLPSPLQYFSHAAHAAPVLLPTGRPAQRRIDRVTASGRSQHGPDWRCWPALLRPLSTGRPAQCGEDQVTAGGRSQTGPGRGGWPALLSDLAGPRAQYLYGNPDRYVCPGIRTRVLCAYSRREFRKLIILSPFDLHDNSRRLPQHPRHYVPWERRERGDEERRRNVNEKTWGNPDYVLCSTK